MKTRKSSGERAARPGIRPSAGLVLAERYVLCASLGRGGHGEVWEADDTVGGGTVAVKILTGASAATAAELCAEVSILRLHQVPGVVRLLDESVTGALPFIVMERVSGDPFPGAGRARSWDRIAETTAALVEILARLHAEGVIHHDLKPANVLVDTAGKPTVLDFGIAADRHLASQDGEHDGDLHATLAYMAPERLDQPATPSADLYSLGVLLFEALAGRRPRLDTPSAPTDPRAWLATPVPPLRTLAPEVPPPVAGLVDLLLAGPERRPRSALDVLGMLRGHPQSSAPEEQLPFRLAGDDALAGVLEMTRCGLAVDLVGPRTAGRSHCLARAKLALESEGRRAVVLRPAPRPFASVMPLAGTLAEQATARLAVVSLVVESRVRSALAEGLVVLADDADRMDPCSAEVLARCRDAGALVRVFDEAGAPRPAAPGTVRITLLDEAQLERLFTGSERLFHARSRPARVLYARTGGVPERVAEELRAWLRAGVAAPDGGRLSVARHLLEQLDRHPVLSHPVRRAPSLPRELDDLLAWLVASYPDGTPEVLGACTHRPVWEVEAEVEELVRRGAARRLPGDRAEPLLAPSTLVSPERRRAEHRAVARALPPGAPRRFVHMVAALELRPPEADVVVIADEAVALAGRLMRSGEGEMGQALASLDEALFQIRRPAEASAALTGAEERVLATQVELAIESREPRTLALVQYALGRARSRSTQVSSMRELVGAALAFGAGGGRALKMLDAIEPFAEIRLERRRQALRALASQRCPAEVEDTTVRDVEAWAAGVQDEETEAELAFLRGWWHYRRDRFAEAARLHAEAAAREPRVRRIRPLIAGASAQMELFELDDAMRRAEEALRCAESAASPHLEARASWLLRAIRYRQGVADAPDLELVEAVAELGMRDIAAQVRFTEACFAYRAGPSEVALALATEAARLWKFVGAPRLEMLARCLALAAGAQAEVDELSSLVSRARTCPVHGFGIQALGLLARAAGRAPPGARRAAKALVSTIAPEHRGRRMDVLSVDEALEALGPAPPRR